MKTSAILGILIVAAVVIGGAYYYSTPLTPDVTPTQTATITFQLSSAVTNYTGTVLTVDGVNYNASQLPKSFTWNVNTSHTYKWVMSLEHKYIWQSTSGSTTLRSNTFNATTNGTITSTYDPWEFKVAAIYVSVMEEDWNQVLHQALLRAEDTLGITYSYTESVSETDCARVMREYINNGYDLIITDSWGFWETSDNIAPQYPNVYFAQGSGLNTNFGKNLVLFDNTLQEVTFQAGALAATITNTDKVGIVAAMPGPGDVASLINGYIAGAKYVNPSINVTLQYINSWYDPNAAKNTAQVMIASGVDVIFSERGGVETACKDGDTVLAYAFGNVVDKNNLDPDVFIGSVIWNLYPLVSEMISGVLNDNFVPGIHYPTLASNGTYMSWNAEWTANHAAAYNYAVGLEPLINNATITWVVNNQTVPLYTPNMGTPVP